MIMKGVLGLRVSGFLLNLISVKQSYFVVLSQFLVSLTNFLYSVWLMRKGEYTEFGVFAFLLSVFFVINAINSSFCISYINNYCVDKNDQVFFARIKVLVGRFCLVFFLQLFVAVAVLLSGVEIYGISSDKVFWVVCSSLVWIVYESVRRIYIYMNRAQVMLLADTLWVVVLWLYAGLYPLEANSYFWIYSVAMSVSVVLLLFRLSGDFSGKVDWSAGKSVYWEFGATGCVQQILGLLYVQSVQVVALSKGGPDLLASYEGPRILVMPIMTLTMGLLNYYNPKYRIAYVESGFWGFQSSLVKSLLQVCVLGLIYVFVLLLAFEMNWLRYVLDGFYINRSVLYLWVIIVMIMMFSTFVSVVFSVVHKPKLSLIGRVLSAVLVTLALYGFYDFLDMNNIAAVRVLGEVVILVSVLVLFFKLKRGEVAKCI